MAKLSAVVEINEIVTDFIKSAIRLSEDPQQVVAGIHNAFILGEIFDDIGVDITHEELGKIFEGIETIQKALLLTWVAV